MVIVYFLRFRFLGLASSDSRIFKLLVWVLTAFIMFVVCKVCNRDLEVARPKKPENVIIQILSLFLLRTFI